MFEALLPSAGMTMFGSMAFCVVVVVVFVGNGGEGDSITMFCPGLALIEFLCIYMVVQNLDLPPV